jgi:hypothetical protein
MVGPRIFVPEEVDLLIPDLEAVFADLDGLRQRIRTLKLRINALELIWGDRVNRPDCPDHGELQQHLEQMKEAQAEFERATQRLSELGAQLKSIEPPLVDFYGVREGRLILWCWTRGEHSVGFWHHVDEGFANRRPLSEP